MKISTLALALAAVIPSLASADEIVLRNGSIFTGAVREEGDRVTIEMDFGTMTFKKIDVKTISRGEDVIRIFEERVAQATSTKELVEVAVWGAGKGLNRRAEDLLLRVIQKEPDQTQARWALGFERIGGQWLQGDALQAARGLVKVDGRWLPRETAERQLDRQMAERQGRDRIELESHVAAQHHEQEMLKLALDRERIELEKKVEEQRAIEAERYRIEQDWALRTGQYQQYNSGPYNNAYENAYNTPYWNQNQPACPPPPAAAPVPAPVQKPQPAPTRRDYSPLPPTPPTVVPISPPNRLPPARETQPHPRNEPKKDEEKDKEKRR